MEYLNSKLLASIPQLYCKLKDIDNLYTFSLNSCFQVLISTITRCKFYIFIFIAKDDKFETNFKLYFVNAFLIRYNSPFLFPSFNPNLCKKIIKVITYFR